MALAHKRPCGHCRLEGLEVGFGLAMEADHRKHRHLEAERAAVNIGVIALDETSRLKRAHTAQAWRRRNAGPRGEIDIGDAPVCLQFGKYPQIDMIELRPLHGPLGR